MSESTFDKSYYDVLRGCERYRPRDWLLIACCPGKGVDQGNAVFRVVAPRPEDRTPAEERMLAAISKNFYRGEKPRIAFVEPHTPLSDPEEGKPKNEVPF